MSKRATFRRTASIFGLVVILSAVLNVLPQAWLLHRYPESRSALLAALLLAGTVTSILGILTSRLVLRKRGELTPAGAVVLVSGLVVTSGALLLEGIDLTAYGVLFCLSRFVANFLINHLDQTLVGRAGDHARHHAAGVVLFQLGGITVGPLLFALLHGWTLTAWAAFALLGLAILVPAWDGLVRTPTPVEPAAVDASGRGTTRVYVFYAYCGLCLVAIYGLAAQLMFVLENHIGVEHPTRWGGILLAVVSIAAGATVLGTMRLGHGAAAPRMTIAAVSITISMAVTALAPPLIGMVAVSCGAGAGYGLFLVSTRGVAASWEGAPGRDVVLSTYNNMTNYASLAAYGLIGVFGLALGDTHPWFSRALLWSLTVVGALAIPLALGWQRVDATSSQS